MYLEPNMRGLTQLALIGTAQGGGAATLTTPVDELVADMPELEPEHALLVRAGSLAIYEQAGSLPAPGGTLPDVAPPDRWPVCSTGAAELMRDLLREQDDLLPEALRRLCERQQRLPPRLLPMALDIRKQELHPLVADVLDERGRWLARRNPAWSWVDDLLAASDDLPQNAEALWEEGTPAQRLAILRRVRALDPDRARAWIEATWRSEKAGMRADLLVALGTHLTASDEALLEAALNDPSVTVRRQAASQLPFLSGSEFAARARTRAEAMFQYTPPVRSANRLQAFLRTVSGTASPATLDVTVPGEPDAAAVRDGIDGRTPQGTSESGWRIVQMLTAVPPAHWTTHFGATPAELIAAVRDDEWQANVIEGWTRAALAHEDADWALALVEWWCRSAPKEPYYRLMTDEMLVGLIALLPQVQAEGFAADFMKERAEKPRDDRRDTILAALPTPWSEEWSRTFLDTFQRYLRRHQAALPWHDMLKIAARALSVSCLDHVLQTWSIDDPDQMDSNLYVFVYQIQRRQRIYKEIV